MTYSPYDRWLNDLTTDEFHEHVAGRMEYDGPQQKTHRLMHPIVWILAASIIYTTLAAIGAYHVAITVIEYL
jgi:hypothetical protein